MFIHPGKSFVRLYGPVQELADVLAYAEYLRRESGCPHEAPIDLAKIYRHFGLPTPKKAPLPNQQGLLLIPEAGLIVINEHDIATRQRFTEAHELMELLFDALPNGKGWTAHQKGPFKHFAKETLCDRGAAQLLMPQDVFRVAAGQDGISFRTAGKLSRRFGVSTTAALVQLVRTAPPGYMLVMWAWKHKKSDLINGGQLTLFDDSFEPPKKLRVEWAVSAPDSPHIPKYKSTSSDSAIFEAFQTGNFSKSQERLDLGTLEGIFNTENWPFLQDGEYRVLSLLEFLK